MLFVLLTQHYSNMKALLLTAFLISSVSAAPGIDMVTQSRTSLELVFQAGNTPVAGFDLWLTFNPRYANVFPSCAQIITDARVICEIVKTNTVRIFVEALYVQDIPLIETSQHLATIHFEWISPKAVTFTVSQEHYFDAAGNEIPARKGKKKWKSKRPPRAVP